MVSVLVFVSSITFANNLPDARKLTQQELEVLVAGIAIYPDQIVTNILDAAQYPLPLFHSSQGSQTPPRQGPFANRLRERRAESPESIEYLKKYPDILKALTQHPLVTVRLGIAGKYQNADVWNAIQAVRNKIDQAGITTEGGTANYATYYDKVVSPLLSSQAAVTLVREVDAVTVDSVTGNVTTVSGGNGTVTATQVNNTTTVTGPGGKTVTATGEGGKVVYTNGNTTVGAKAGQATVSGPGGNSATGTGAAVGGVTKQGDTVYAGAAGAGNVTTTTGQDVSGAGYATGKATKTGDTASWDTQAAGGAVNNNTGTAVGGQHQGSGTATKNADGSVDYSRTGANKVETNTGKSATTTHTGEGTYTGDGTGSHSGSTTVQTNQGTVSTDSSISKGNSTTTVTTNNGSKTFTAGDHHVNNIAANSKNSSRYSKMDGELISMGNQSLQQSWSKLNPSQKSHATSGPGSTGGGKSKSSAKHRGRK